MADVQIDGPLNTALSFFPPGPTVVLQQRPVTVLKIVAPDGRDLLTVTPDGEVTGAMEDMGEAAAVFVRTVRSLLAERTTDG